MIHPVFALTFLVGGVLGAWLLSWFITDHVVGSRKPGRSGPPASSEP